MTVFSFLTILSKHSKEPVKPETKTHHSSYSQSSKNSLSHKKTTTNSSTVASTNDETRNPKEEDKDQASSSVKQPSQKQNGNTPHHQEKPKSFEGGRGWGGPEDGSYAITEGGRGWGGPGDGSYVTNRYGESEQSSSSNEINEWSTNADNSTYEYPQSSSSANTSLTVKLNQKYALYHQVFRI